MDVHLAQISRHRRIGRWVGAVVCAVAIAALFQFHGNNSTGYIKSASLFYWWGYQWNNPGSETEHGWLVLGLSGWLLVRNLKKAENPELRAERLNRPALDSRLLALRSGFALVAMVAGLALHAVGFVAQQTRVSILAFLLCTWGVLRLGGGRRWGAAAMFPLTFMMFAIPINVLDSIGFWLRVWVVDASGAIARASGIAVLQSGTQLVAPDGNYNYDVAAACSGIRSLTAMAALSLLAGYLNFRGFWRRAVVLLICFPLVYLGNVARIVAIIFAAEAGGPKWGDVAHDVMGYGIFVIVLGGVLLAIAVIRRWWPEEQEAAPSVEGPRTKDQGPRDRGAAPESAAAAGGALCPDSAAPEDGRGVKPLPQVPQLHPADGRAARPYLSYLVAGVVVALVAGEMVFLKHIAERPNAGDAGVRLAADGKDPVELPRFLGIDWTGQPQPVSAAEREILPPDTGYSRKLYFSHRDPSKQVFLSIVLSGRDRSSIHRPELCLVGQGWTVAEGREHAFRFPAGGGAFAATVLPVRREVQTPQGKRIVPQVVAYWFVGSDAVVATHWKRVLLDAWNRVSGGRADRWAYVLMQTDAVDGEAAALARMQAVLDATLPEFQKRLGG